jgi:hypothetical protein
MDDLDSQAGALQSLRLDHDDSDEWDTDSDDSGILTR